MLQKGDLITLKIFNKLLVKIGEFLGIFNNSLAFKCFDKVISLDPYNYDALKGVTISYMRMGRMDDIMGYMDNLLESYPDIGFAWHEKGFILSKRGKRKDAEKCYREALKCYERDLQRNPSDPVALSNAGTIYRNLGKYNEAMTHFNKSLKNQDFWRVKNLRFLTALEVDPKHAHAWKDKGNILISLGKNREAIRCFDEALKGLPDDVEILVATGNALRGIKEYDAALMCFDRALYVLPDYSRAFLNKGFVLWEIKEYEKAMECFDQVIKKYPQDETAWYSKGVTLVCLNRYQDAVDAFDEAIRLNPDFSEAKQSKEMAIAELEKQNE